MSQTSFPFDRWGLERVRLAFRVAEEWQRKQREYARKSARKWRAENPEKARAIKHARRARKNNAPGLFTDAQYEARFAMWGGRCAYCGGEATEVDHVIPLARGGTNWPANLRPACKRCNSSKGKKTLAEWRATR